MGGWEGAYTYTVGCDRNRMANLSKASNVVQERYILYDITGFTQKWHSIPVATNCRFASTHTCSDTHATRVYRYTHAHTHMTDVCLHTYRERSSPNPAQKILRHFFAGLSL